MQPGQSLVLGLVIVLVVLVIAAYYWYHHTGWTTFSFKGTPSSTGGAMAQCSASQPCPEGTTCQSGFCWAGTPPSWAAAKGENIAALRFKGCTFTVVDPTTGETHSADVTTVLNGMAVAYRGASSKIPTVLHLDRPLNAFSFQIPGVNDSATVTTPEGAKKWAASATTLTGSVRTI
jgi:hypothetical protein